MSWNHDNMREPSFDDREDEPEPPRRIFLHEPGWGIGIKSGSYREFCYTMAPGQDFYHRIVEGEVYLLRGHEKSCLACAARRGLIVSEPKRLREVIGFVPAGSGTIPLDIDTRDVRRSHG